MSFVQSESVTVTTAADGSATAYTTGVYTGRVARITYTKTDFADGVDFDVTGEATGIVIWDQDNVNATATVCPRQATHTTAGVASVYAAADGVLTDIHVVNERIEFVVANGGDTKTGAFRVWVD
jgi:hypothetical protein